MTSLFRQGVISTALTLFTSLAAASSAEINKHLELGSKFLAKAQFADALTQYHAAVELDPNNYQALFRRATTYLAMGRGKAALPDLDRVLELKPDFSHARIHRGNILLKQGELDGAENDFNVVLSSEPNNEEISEKVDQIGHLRQFAHQVKMAYDSGDCSTAEHYISQIIEVMLWDASLYRMRAKCLEERGEIKKAIHDMRSISKLTSDSTDVMFETSQLFYKIGEIDECLTVIRECLKLNPDHKLCYPFYKKIRKVVRMRDGMKQKMAEEDWIGCLQKGQEIMKFDTTPSVQLNVYRSTCKCNREADHIAEAITECSEVLKEDPTDVEMLCERAEAHLIAEDYDAAINDFKAGQEINPDHSCVKDGVDRANKLKTQASKRDYYKILGVKRNASKREITKAYRKLAQKWHPDNFSDEVEKKKAEKKFIDIAAAKEVLQDDEKRRQFDQGIDPLDPESQRQGGHGGFHHGFPHGFHHFGGGGGGGGEYTYKFHF